MSIEYIRELEFVYVISTVNMIVPYIKISIILYCYFNYIHFYNTMDTLLRTYSYQTTFNPLNTKPPILAFDINRTTYLLFNQLLSVIIMILISYNRVLYGREHNIVGLWNQNKLLSTAHQWLYIYFQIYRATQPISIFVLLCVDIVTYILSSVNETWYAFVWLIILQYFVCIIH